MFDREEALIGRKVQHDLQATSDSIFKAVFKQTGIFAGIMDLQGYLRDASDLSLKFADIQRIRFSICRFGTPRGGVGQKK